MDIPGIIHINLPRYDFVGSDIPAVIPRQDIVSSLPELHISDLTLLRAQLLRAICMRTQPIAVYLDAYPFHPGKSEKECGVLTSYIKKECPHVKIYSGFRGALSRPLSNHKQDRVCQLLDENVDELFVFVDPRDEEGAFKQAPFLKDVKRTRISACGLVGISDMELPRHEPASSGLWVASFGGGIDAFHKIEMVVEAFKRLSEFCTERRLTLSTGTRLPQKLFEKLIESSARDPRISIARHIPAIVNEYRNAELVICMGGYNSCTELLYTRAKTLVLPRISEENSEQLHEAQMIQKYGAIDQIVDVRRTSAIEFAVIIKDILRKKKARQLDVDLSGAISAVKKIFPDEFASRAEVSPNVIAGF